MRYCRCVSAALLILLAGGSFIAKSQTVSGEVVVRGRVARPGIVTFDAPLNISEAIERAGGLLPTALTSQVRITRTLNGRRFLFLINLEAVRKGKARDVALESGDIIEVPRKRSRLEKLQRLGGGG